ncbi:hypothetical protein HDE78_004085 [Rhodanobacter sp. K2T2]|uniref:hypothetical protein n=1 Tax=Rhodanobacter sp. K2T2 TaxID=2723085 RepID=UPI0015C9957A|nr:hypothetical protein [Rhodanobacter sp. K2T2]NYE31102.1 hypothetical protein [Rhodanobacter sp. K2T2]
MELIENDNQAATPTDSAIEDESRYGETLAELLGNLQGLAEDAVVGAGLARFSAQRLIAIRYAAQRRVETQLQGMAALLQVMRLATREFGDRLAPHVMSDIAAHLQWQTQELTCWGELANQAAYIREHPDFARSLAQRYVQQAQTLGEWPSA